MKGRVHFMPFGATLTADGVRFRLWAPAAHGVRIRIEGQPAVELSLSPRSRGWHELLTDAAGAGSRYTFRIDDGPWVPDPAARFQPDGVHGPSEVIDPAAFRWSDTDWRGRPWEEAVIYELHVGTFTPGGSFAGVIEKLDHLAALGVTAIELMPVAAFPGQRNWGYDGVLPFAPAAVYGRPEALKSLVQAAHARGLMVFLDVVYNHFGPEGNYLHHYAPQFFTRRHRTPWGDAINFDDAGSEVVRRFFIDNSLYWLTEYHFDGLRVDAVHAIFDDRRPDIIEELAAEVRRRISGRHVHLVLENDRNTARYMNRDADGSAGMCTAQWNDDIHHALHLLTTGETGGYYRDYATRPAWFLARCLAEGFGYQGEPSPYRNGEPRGEPSAHLPPTAFVSFLQNHDQVGNRACGERLHDLAPPEAVRAAIELLLLAPQPPLLFMGQEWCTAAPFLFFCDFEPALAAAVTTGRRREFARFPQFSRPEARARIPDPSLAETFIRSRLRWGELADPSAREWLALHRRLLALRALEVVPRLSAITGASYRLPADRTVEVTWSLIGGEALRLAANLSALPADIPLPCGRRLYGEAPASGPMPAWSVFLSLDDCADREVS